MNNSVDFNIDNYTISDLEKYFNLDYYYNDDEVNKKVYQFTQKISDLSNISLKNKLLTFINQAKDKLLNDNDRKLIISMILTLIHLKIILFLQVLPILLIILKLIQHLKMFNKYMLLILLREQ